MVDKHVTMDYLLYHLQDDRQGEHLHSVCSLRAWCPVEPWNSMASWEKMAVDATREGALEQNFSDGCLMLGIFNFAFVFAPRPGQ